MTSAVKATTTHRSFILDYAGLCKASASHTGSAARGFSFQSRRLSSVPGKYEDQAKRASCKGDARLAGEALPEAALFFQPPPPLRGLVPVPPVGLVNCIHCQIVPRSRAPVAYPHPSLGNYYQGALSHRIRIVFDQIEHCGHLLGNLHIYEADDARVRHAAHEHQLTKVLIFGDEHALLFVRQYEQRFIRSGRVAVHCRQYIVSLLH